MTCTKSWHIFFPAHIPLKPIFCSPEPLRSLEIVHLPKKCVNSQERNIVLHRGDQCWIVLGIWDGTVGIGLVYLVFTITKFCTNSKIRFRILWINLTLRWGKCYTNTVGCVGDKYQLCRYTIFTQNTVHHPKWQIHHHQQMQCKCCKKQIEQATCTPGQSFFTACFLLKLIYCPPKRGTYCWDCLEESVSIWSWQKKILLSGVRHSIWVSGKIT